MATHPYEIIILSGSHLFDFGDGEPEVGTYDSSRDIIIWAGFRFVNERDGAVIEQPNQPPDRDEQINQPDPPTDDSIQREPETDLPNRDGFSRTWIDWNIRELGLDFHNSVHFSDNEFFIVAYGVTHINDHELFLELNPHLPTVVKPPPSLSMYLE